MLSLQKAITERKALLLFYREFEQDKFVKYDRYLKRIARPFYNLLHHRQKQTGFAVSFELLKRALLQSGWVVRINDRALARRNPTYPVGLVGFPSVLDDWDLPNPAILGPSLYDHPLLAPQLMQDTRFRKYLVLAPWMYDMFRPVYGDACVRWHAGIDTEVWRDTGSCGKDIDFLIYDKIRWNHDQLAGELLHPIEHHLRRRGLRIHTVRYKLHDHLTYRQLLQRSRAMIFLCEHETQGLAYQEALASNIPILAWDNGYWLDPLWRRVSERMIPASSVPFFSKECGERFAKLDEFQSALDIFLDRMDSYEPRSFVIKNLSLQESATIYSRAYFSLIGHLPVESYK
jgi:glycosyltransferase involved in cell wall biosynthesis